MRRGEFPILKSLVAAALRLFHLGVILRISALSIEEQWMKAI